MFVKYIGVYKLIIRAQLINIIGLKKITFFNNLRSHSFYELNSHHYYHKYMNLQKREAVLVKQNYVHQFVCPIQWSILPEKCVLKNNYPNNYSI